MLPLLGLLGVVLVAVLLLAQAGTPVPPMVVLQAVPQMGGGCLTALLAVVLVVLVLVALVLALPELAVVAVGG